jgi:hypothetical protein
MTIVTIVAVTLVLFHAALLLAPVVLVLFVVNHGVIIIAARQLPLVPSVSMEIMVLLLLNVVEWHVL